MKKTIVRTIIIGIASLAAVIVSLSASLSLAGCDNLQNSDIINIAAIKGVTVPAAGGIPVTAITETGQYTGTVKWKITDGAELTGNFVVSISYTATITLTPKTGYTLTGVEKNFFTVAGADSVKNDANSGIITAVFPAAPKIININNIVITAPAAGKIPVTAITETEQYAGKVTWNDNPATFAVSTVYIATITLTPKTGYTLQGVEADFFTVAGTTSIISNDADSGVITAVFPRTLGTAANPITVDIKNIELNELPATGADPYSLEVIETRQYTGYISLWSPDHDSFSYTTNTYTATITLTAKTGCTFTGVTADYFNVVGSKRTINSAIPKVPPDEDSEPEFIDTIDIIAQFSVSLNKIDTDEPIEDLAVPATGESPSTEIIPTDQYTGTVAWYEKGIPFSSSKIFKPGMEYTAKITLKAKTGYTFNNVASNSLSVSGAIVGKTAKSVSNPAGSGSSIVITVVYNDTDADQITEFTIMGVDFPKAGKKPQSISNKRNLEYTAEIVWNIPSTSLFAAGEIYTATITLTPKSGYTFKGVGADSFSIADADGEFIDVETCSNVADSGIVSVVFQKTASNPDRIIYVSSAPVTGGSFLTEGDFTIAGCEIVKDIVWSPNPSDGIYRQNTAYKATLTISPEDGFTLYNMKSDYFIVSGVPVTSVTYTAGSAQGKVAITFLKTGPAQ